MSLLNDASLILVPSAIKTGEVLVQKPLPNKFADETGNYDGNDPQGSANLTFTRASSATRVGPDGLIEKVRTNLALQSQTFDNAYWFKTNTTVVANSGIAPNGTTTAELVYPTTTGSNRLLEKSFSISAATPYTGTWYLKASGLNWVAVDHIDGTVGAWFNLSTGTIGTIAAGTTASIENVGNGYYRCRISKTSVGTTGYHVIRLVDGDNTTSVTANGTDGLLVWGAQLETGDIATDYIATTTAAVSVGPVSGLPRLDYLGSSCGKLLLEGQRTNLVLFSEQMNVWTNGTASVTANATTSPDGYQNADSINNTADVSTFVGASNVAHTFSLFVKQGTSATASIDMSDGATGDAITTFTFATKTFSGTSAGGSWTSPSTAYQDYGNGWYRIALTATKGGGSTIGYKIIPSGTGTTFVWGAQLEAGAYATSYIPTLGTSVTRVADAASKTGTGISSLIGQTEGTILLDLVGGSDSVNVAFRASDGTNNNRVQFEWSGSSSANYIVSSGGSIQAIIIGIYCPQGTRHKIALAYKQNDFVIYLDGSQVGSDTSGAVPTSLTQIEFSEGAASPYTGTVNQALLFKTRLSNAKLAELTTL
jgi:hypothetical protein